MSLAESAGALGKTKKHGLSPHMSLRPGVLSERYCLPFVSSVASNSWFRQKQFEVSVNPHGVIEATDFDHMARALQLARRGLYTTDPNPRVGAVVVKDGRVIGEGFHVRAGEPHAEVLALKQAGEAARGATVCVTLEPCNHHGRTPPCVDALIAAGVARVVAAMRDPNPLAADGFARLQAAGIATASGVLENEARALNPGFVKRMTDGLPWLRVKLAMSLDGRTAMANGESQWITGEAARNDVQRLRARSSAVMTGIGTLLADDPSLNVRLMPEVLGIKDEVRQPLRVVLDTRLQTPPTARLLTLPGRTLIMTAVDDGVCRKRLEAAGAEVCVMPEIEGRLDLHAVVRELARRGLNEIHVEAGLLLSGALLAAGLVDELVIYMAPHLMGSEARGLLHLPGLAHMRDRVPLKITDLRAVGDDWRITAVPM